MGLVAREIEAAGISTVVLSNIPDLTAGAGAPRTAAIEHPIGLTLGRPGDAPRQLDVLAKTLTAFESLTEPGGVIHLPFEWDETAGRMRTEPPVPPPIASYLLRRPWLLPRLYTRSVPR